MIHGVYDRLTLANLSGTISIYQRLMPKMGG